MKKQNENMLEEKSLAFSSKTDVVHCLPIHVLEDYLHTLPQCQIIPIIKGNVVRMLQDVESLAVW